MTGREGRPAQHTDENRRPMTISHLLRERRRSLGHHQADAAAAVGVAQTTIAKWENGTVPGTKHVPRLAEYLGMSQGELAATLYGGGQLDDRVAQLEERLEQLNARVECLFRDR